MIDAKRNPNTTYRVDRRLDGIYLRTFPPAPERVAEAWYRMDQIPQWLIEAMALLDAAAPASIPDIGYRLGELVYWVEPPWRNTAGDRSTTILTESAVHRSCEIIYAKAEDETDEAWREAVREGT